MDSTLYSTVNYIRVKVTEEVNFIDKKNVLKCEQVSLKQIKNDHLFGA